MSKYLISKTEVYRADTENEAASLIESANAVSATSKAFSLTSGFSLLFSSNGFEATFIVAY